MRVEFGDLDRRVPHDQLHLVHRDPASEVQRVDRAAEVMEAQRVHARREGSDLVAPGVPLDRPGQVLRGLHSPARSGKYEIEILFTASRSRKNRHEPIKRRSRFTAFNARDDTFPGREWKEPFQHRGMLPATWCSKGKKIWALPSGEPFFLAVITVPRGVDDVVPELSYAMVTRAAIGESTSVVTARAGSRMPLVVPAALHDEWLDPERAGDEDLIAQVVRASEDRSRPMTAAS